ncbi:MAG: glycosyltransferase family 2 protein, partial [Flavobacteriales bacterium]
MSSNNNRAIVDVIIPAFNEESSIAKVIEEIPNNEVREVIVVNNNSTDMTAARAKNAGAVVLDEKKQGYGNACLKGIDFLRNKEVKPDIVAFLDSDHSDKPEELPSILSPLKNNEADIVIGSRVLGNREIGSMLPQQIFGNRLATFLLRLFYGVKYTDLGPFRAITYEKLNAIGMKDRTYGWTVEMQSKAAKQQLIYKEVPVSYR